MNWFPNTGLIPIGYGPLEIIYRDGHCKTISGYQNSHLWTIRDESEDILFYRPTEFSRYASWTALIGTGLYSGAFALGAMVVFLNMV